MDLYNRYSALYKSLENGASRGSITDTNPPTVDPVELAKKLRRMSVPELETYRDSILAAHPEYPTKAVDPQVFINNLLQHFTAEEVAAYLNFTDEYPFVENRPDYLQNSTLGLQPQLQRLYASSAAGIDNLVVPFTEYLLDQPMEMVVVHITEGALYAECEHALVHDLEDLLIDDVIVSIAAGEIDIEGIIAEDVPYVILAVIQYILCKHGHHI